jgi:acetylornithine deacetylase/succinyl-diaminopimelate desuccinylase-like protein
MLAVAWGLVVPMPLGAQAAATSAAVDRLRSYLQIDTTNPPGNEAEAARWLAEILRQAGLRPRLLESPEGRTSLYVRWRAEAGVNGPALVLLHHIDVVPAGDDWTYPPFSGRIAEGKIWGRGALDVKSLGITQLEALLSLRGEGVRLEKDLILLAVADEEAGGGQGVGWLLDAHPELFVGVEGVLNEGGNNRTLQGHVALWGVEVAQKRPFWLRITAYGRGGHASGFHPGSATHQLIRGLAKLVDRPLLYRMTEPARLYFQALAELSEGPEADVSGLTASLASDTPRAGLMPGQEVYFVDTLQVTRIETSEGANVVAPVARARVDGRLLPDTDDAALLAEIRQLLGADLEVDVVLRADPVPPSPTDHPVWRALEEVLAVRAPLVPTFLPGTTDSRYFRARGIAAYGFSPFAIDATDLGGIHGVDESIPVDEFLRGIETMRRVLVAYGTDPTDPE